MEREREGEREGGRREGGRERGREREREGGREREGEREVTANSVRLPGNTISMLPSKQTHVGANPVTEPHFYTGWLHHKRE